jgi:hypothetical protein
MDITRQLSTYARPFGAEYARLVLASGYAPAFETLMEDYLRLNPTRNRALDMLPMFAWFDEAKVQAAVHDPRVRKRPTFHYRLPNCSLDAPGWSVVREWNWWVEVERLAEDHDRRKEMALHYLQWLDFPLESLLGNWAGEARRWMG